MEIDINNLKKLMCLYKRLDKALEITVDGTSMLPVLKPGDKISVKKLDDYKIGDILVFRYYKDNLTIHRLLRKRKGIYTCKGDNSYNLENVMLSDIIGVMVPIRYEKFHRFKAYIISMISYRIGLLSIKAKFNTAIIHKSIIFKIFYKFYIKYSN